MEPSAFNVRAALPGRDEVFLMNTLTDAQAVVSPAVVDLLERAGNGLSPSELSADERAALDALAAEGFLVNGRVDERAALERFFADFRDDPTQLRVTVLTTLQCNFACDYCIQGDHGDYNRHAGRMSLEEAGRVASWIESRLDAVAPESFVLTFFGGEPLLNLPVVYYLAERLWQAAVDRRVTMLVNVITNGLLLTPEVVDRLSACGLNGVKVTLDGDRVTHDRMRPLRNGQGTFDRIVANLRAVAGRCRISIGGNFDEGSIHAYPALLAFLREQDFAASIAKVNFKPVIGTSRSTAKGHIPLTPVAADGKPLGGACMSTVGTGGGSPCDSCHFVDEQLATLRAETRRHGFPTPDGLHMGPCEIHKRHAHTVGPDGSLYACPGFAAESAHAVGHIGAAPKREHEEAAARFESLAAWRRCGDCAFIPVCGGGCTVASHNELGDMHAPTCHKASFESALAELAQDVAGQG